MRWIVQLFFLSALIILPNQAQALVSPASVSIVPPVQFPPADFSITGARVSAFWGQHRDVYGVDVGAIGNITNQRFVGTGISGVFNITHGNTTILGAQLAGGANINTNKITVVGTQLALGINVNEGSSAVTGLQLSLANLSSHTNIYGVQAGLYNQAKDVYGFQIGLVNAATSLHGLQIGLVNFNHEGIFRVAPILNVGF